MGRRSTTSVKAWDVLCAHPGEELGLVDIAVATGLTVKQVRDALWVITSRLGHDVENVRPGVVALRSAPGELGVQRGIHGGSPPDHLFERVAVTISGSVILRDADGRLYEARDIAPSREEISKDDT